MPSASTGGMPASSSAGMVMRPPPPAMESTKPAAKAAAPSMKRMCRDGSNMAGPARAYARTRSAFGSYIGFSEASAAKRSPAISIS